MQIGISDAIAKEIKQSQNSALTSLISLTSSYFISFRINSAANRPIIL